MMKTRMEPIWLVGKLPKTPMKPPWGPLSPALAAYVGLSLDQLRAAAHGGLVLSGAQWDALARREHLWGQQ